MKPNRYLSGPFCALCGGVVGAGNLEVQLRRDTGIADVLFWHLTPDCAGADPLHDDLANAFNLPDGLESEVAAEAAYQAILASLPSRHGRKAKDIVRHISVESCSGVSIDMPKRV